MRRLSRIGDALLVAAVAASAAVAARAQPQRGFDEPGIDGYVLSPDGVPVSAGTVTIQSYPSPSTAAIAPNGRFRIVPNRSGAYQITISVPGLSPYRVGVAIPSSRSMRLPIVRLEPAAYARVRFVAPNGEAITAPQLRRRSFDSRGNPIPQAEESTERPDGNGATIVGPLPRGITAMALDMPSFAQTRVPDIPITGASPLVDAGTIVVQRGATLDVDLVDTRGAPVAGQEVLLEATEIRSPLSFPKLRTDAQGRVTFDRLARGRYRVRTSSPERCMGRPVAIERTVTISGTGTTTTRIVATGRAAFRIVSAGVPVRGVLVSIASDAQPLDTFDALGGCTGGTDVEGRVALVSFPPGPSRVEVHFGDSTYMRKVNVPLDGSEQTIMMPDGFLPVRAMSARANEPIPGATITWTANGARVEARASAIGEALLENVGAAAGTLSVAARGYLQADETFSEPPAVLHDIALQALPVTTLPVRVVTAAGEPIANAMVMVSPRNPIEAPRIAVTDARGGVTFTDVAAGALDITAAADGFAAALARIPDDTRTAGTLTLSRGYRAIAAVDLTADAGPQLIRVFTDGGAQIDDLLDILWDRVVEPTRRVSIGPLAPGRYVVEFGGERGRRRAPISIVDRDVVVTVPATTR